jgi:hypothetical protein
MKAFNSADVLPKRVGVPNMIPSAHSASAEVGPQQYATPLSLSSRVLPPRKTEERIFWFKNQVHPVARRPNT